MCLNKTGTKKERKRKKKNEHIIFTTDYQKITFEACVAHAPKILEAILPLCGISADLFFLLCQKNDLKTLQSFPIAEGLSKNSLLERGLAEASEKGHEDIVRFIAPQLASRPSLLVVPLEFASSHGHLPCVKALVESGADPKIRDSGALNQALLKGRADISEYLFPLSDGKVVKKKLIQLKKYASKDTKDKSGQTPLRRTPVPWKLCRVLK